MVPPAAREVCCPVFRLGAAPFVVLSTRPLFPEFSTFSSVFSSLQPSRNP